MFEHIKNDIKESHAGTRFFIESQVEIDNRNPRIKICKWKFF